jgi:hypothetical protein
VTKDVFGGVGSKHCSSVCNDFGDVVIASNTCGVNRNPSTEETKSIIAIPGVWRGR